MFGARLLTNEHLKLMWFTYGGPADCVKLESFLKAVETYVQEQLGMSAEAVEGVLTPECRESLTLALDVDSNGEVGSFNLPLSRCGVRFPSCQCKQVELQLLCGPGNTQLAACCRNLNLKLLVST